VLGECDAVIDAVVGVLAVDSIGLVAGLRKALNLSLELCNLLSQALSFGHSPVPRYGSRLGLQKRVHSVNSTTAKETQKKSFAQSQKKYRHITCIVALSRSNKIWGSNI
jgi:hypothetical protein